jgi:hypothetical protein
MFVTDRLIYLQLQKTGCSHISNLLSKICSGQKIGKHNNINNLPKELQESNKYIVGSIRNPWDWYVSLWAFGCDGKGGVYHHLALPKNRRGKLYRKFGSEPLSDTYKRLMGLKDIKKWRRVYRDSSDPQLFREWLHMMFDSRSKIHIGENYEKSSVSNLAGLLTYRYLKIFSKHLSSLYSTKFTNLEDIKQFDLQNNVLDDIIYNENLEQDLRRVLANVGITIPKEKEEQLFSSKSKTNSSSRKRNLSFYYNNETIELIKEKEKFIIEKYNYEPPELLNVKNLQSGNLVGFQ